ncbi:PLP-dependent transferase [Choiromyces venosus 120613-1]|uniref:cysteine desulfurase n=1 Tax=Choiromyces venosus 120613-1 TaxID=1336337 RepID=A0A3N4JP78_9PEZI|nr:PLP-dependent transferase [Choiromyces venosus 120613-1]
MTMATKVVQCIASFSYASLSPAATLQRGLTAQLCCRFISSSGKDAEAAAKVGLEDQRIGAGNFMNQAGLKPVGVDVGNGLMAGATVSPSTSIFKQTTILDVGSQPISLDMQATTPTDPCMLDAMLAIYTSLYGNPHSLTHAHGWETRKVIDAACDHVAKLIGAHPKEIIFTSGTTNSNNLSIKCVARLYKSKKHIITLQREHKCVLNSCRHLQDQGYDITYLPTKNNGLINLEHLEKEVRPDIVLVSIMTINNEIGVIQSMEMGKLCQKKGVFFHTDGAQAVGKIPVDISKWNVDLISISGPKVYGPKGIGASYVHHRPKVRIEPLISGGGQERGLHSRTLTYSLLIGSGEACRIAQEQIEALPSHPLLWPLSD